MSSHTAESRPDSLAPGTKIGPWCVERLHGRGTYGTVYRVRSDEPGETGVFALKLAHFPWDPRFEREGLLLSRIRHDSVPKLRDRGGWRQPRGDIYPCLVMEWVEGVALYEWAARGKCTSRQILRVLAQLARALEATHQADGVHRDVKGDNVLVNPEGFAWLVDFGAGKFKGARSLTQETLPPGTQAYRSPQALRFLKENYRDRGAHYEATEADDVYALGVTAYRAVTGRYPPPGTDLDRAFDPKHAPLPPLQPPSALVSMCPELEGLILRMLSDMPEERGRAGEVAHSLEQAAASAGHRADAPILPHGSGAAAKKSRPRSRRIRQAFAPAVPWLGGAVGGAFLAAVTWWMVQPREQSPSEVQQEHVSDEESEGTVALGDTGQPVPTTEGAQRAQPSGIGLEMPKRPFPGQVVPPCKKGFEAEIELTPGKKETRSCWIEVKAAEGLCKPNGYEYRGGCYLPVYPPAKLPQSVKQ
ncbi:serine/threonine protein kinase [Hyalangium rubrum]|uniref:Serine/threonine-protein kinase n=1 Tax=Hyalangium rubrum TaxID=3103134 RepID=A0ABU5H131_9BACT|nr:serine/threonine-protein kinase [Hyalangium sp. s54d21]MDY7227166.1 serine/threonine-protein kinase [Hyalangium sp. s54d21]